MILRVIAGAYRYELIILLPQILLLPGPLLRSLSSKCTGDSNEDVVLYAGTTSFPSKSYNTSVCGSVHLLVIEQH